MLSPNGYLREALNVYTETKKEWDDHMAKPDYCLTKNYFLYKKYMLAYESLIKIEKLCREYRELEKRIKNLKN